MTTMAARLALLDTYRTALDDLAGALAGIGEAELDAPQPPGEWTPRQIVHHLADSESLSYIRVRRLIADPSPIIEGYDEPEWARRLHYDRPIEASLAVIAAVRTSSLELLEGLAPGEWERQGRHTESGAYSLDRWLEIYAAHTHEHADQIRRAGAAVRKPVSPP